MHAAVRSRLHHEQARKAWLEIIQNEYDRSRRVGLVSQMIAEQDDALSVPLLLEALGFELVGRWSGDQIVRHLLERGKVAEVTQRLNALLSNPSTTEEHASILQSLLAICDE
jgi:hypothetical protein